MAAQTWVNSWPPFTGADGSALASSTTLTDISPGGAVLNSGITIPGGALQIGTYFRVTARGKFSNTSTPTLLLGLYWGGVAGTALAATTAVTTTTGATNWPWHLDLVGKVTAIGTSGAIEIVSGTVKFPTALTTFSERFVPEVAITPTTVDTSVAKLISIGAQWGTNNASNTITCALMCVEQLN